MTNMLHGYPDVSDWALASRTPLNRASTRLNKTWLSPGCPAGGHVSVKVSSDDRTMPSYRS